MHVRSLALAFAFPLVLLACKKEAPASGTAGSAAAVSAGAPALVAPAATGGAGLAILKDFEGKISWAVKGKLAAPKKGGGDSLNLALLVKSGKFRLDLPPGLGGVPGTGAAGAGAYLLGNPQEKKFHVVTEAQKQALLINADKLAAQAEAMGGKSSGPGAGNDAPELKKTGKVDKVAGYSCEVWQITHKDSRMEACIAAEGTDWLKLPVAKLPAKYSWASELTDGKHFPLRFVMLDKTGGEEGRIELTSIEKKPIDAAQLEIPAGYQVIDLDQMLGGMMQGLSGMHGRPGMPSLSGLPGQPKAPKPAASAKKR